MKIDDFDYDLPQNLIAEFPAYQRDQSRLLILKRAQNTLIDESFSHLIHYLNPGDLVIFNNSKVMPARVFGEKQSGGKVELLIERLLNEGNEILAHIKANRPPKNESFIQLPECRLKLCHKQNSLYTLQVVQGDIWHTMANYGEIPLPPYINRALTSEDWQRYQTVYAHKTGSVAAPTAGLHFTHKLMQSMKDHSIGIGYVTLHVGAGTFQPVQMENIDKHQMHSEYLEVSQNLCDRIKQTKSYGGRVIAVGTTTVRSLETAGQNGTITPYIGDSDLFLYPGKRFNIIDGMITNFHLPRSTLLMMVSAFAGHQAIMDAYEHAIKEKYRFFSYGDAMLIL
jgi:S-adenosylmethionine:tRNA ribosyltransferase-isomerase